MQQDTSEFPPAKLIFLSADTESTSSASLADNDKESLKSLFYEIERSSEGRLSLPHCAWDDQLWKRYDFMSPYFMSSVI